MQKGTTKILIVFNQGCGSGSRGTMEIARRHTESSEIEKVTTANVVLGEGPLFHSVLLRMHGGRQI